MRRRGALMTLLLAAGLSGCSALPDKPVRQTLYDFGPAPSGGPAAAPPAQALLLPEVEATGLLETTALLYRLAYDDPFQSRPYAYARWTAPPGRLLDERLRELLSRDRPVLDRTTSLALNRRGDRPPVLRLELEEFHHLFDAPGSSRGVLRLRATLLESTPGGERLVAQRSFRIDRPAPSHDAAGGVRALTAAVEAAAREIAAWLPQP